MADTTNNAETPTSVKEAEDRLRDAAASAEAAQRHTNEGNYTQAGKALDKAQEQARKADDANNPDKLREYIAKLEADNRKLKDENGDRRVKAKEVQEQSAEFKKKVAQLFGFESDDDPETMLKKARQEAADNAQRSAELQAELDRLREDAQLRQVVERAGGDQAFLMPFLRGHDLPEWGSDEWESKVTGLVKDTMERYQDARAVKAPRSSGNAQTPPNNSNGEKPVLGAEELKRLYDAGDYEAINEAAREGRIAR